MNDIDLFNIDTIKQILLSCQYIIDYIITDYAIISETYRSINNLGTIIFCRDKHDLTMYISYDNSGLK
jgi:hypothetical protein